MASNKQTNEAQNVVKILVFGASGMGKTSMINLLTGKKNEVGNGSLQGCTFETKEISVIKNEKLYIFTDTVGLNEAQNGRVEAGKALTELIELIKKAKSGFNLVIFVRKAEVLKTIDNKNYDLIIKHLLEHQVKTLCVNTGGESFSDVKMNEWWIQNQQAFLERKMRFDGGVSGCFAQTSRNQRLAEIFREYSQQTYNDTWEAIDRYKSDIPTFPKGGLSAILKSVWNYIFGYFNLRNMQYYNEDVKALLIDANLTEERAHYYARMVEED